MPKGTQPVAVLKTKLISHLLCGFFMHKLPVVGHTQQKVEVTNGAFCAPLFVPERKQTGFSSLFGEHVFFQTSLQGTLLNGHEHQQSFRTGKQHK